MTGRRVHERFEYEMRVVIEVDGREIHAVTRNVSMGGLYVLTDEALEYGAAVRTRFRLPALDKDTECPAVVRWTKEDGVGLQFGSLRALDVWGLNQLMKSVVG